ncbi:hypothetical protein FSP39_007969 [Pinctada imbricata]|uniref:Uncharacterized protein n=1 Tax=Pinctada imbricata TaxID=66713 RepID=A0AA88YN25_PINIB|nr:hypothetical protein FSP39_007969 [Pinctada imbricata]
MDVLNATDNSFNRFNGSDHHVIYLDTSSNIACSRSSNVVDSSTESSNIEGKNNSTENIYGNSSIPCQNCSTTLINCSQNATQTNETTNSTSDNQLEELQKPSYISQTNNSIEISVSSIDNDNSHPNYDYLYHEVPGDDSNLHDYMIAVIVSLCVAIFAVIAVISTFFLLEFLSRRKQLRNTKIRPFVS